MAGKKEIWFKNKRFGYGWRPSTWQGWSTVLVYAAYASFITVWFLSSTVIRTVDALLYIGLMAFGLGAFIWIMIEYGEKPKWRWGRK